MLKIETDKLKSVVSITGDNHNLAVRMLETSHVEYRRAIVLAGIEDFNFKLITNQCYEEIMHNAVQWPVSKLAKVYNISSDSIRGLIRSVSPFRAIKSDIVVGKSIEEISFRHGLPEETIERFSKRDSYRLDDNLVATIVTKLKEGLSVKDIAHNYGVVGSTVTYIKRKYNIRASNADRRAQARKLRAQGKSQESIGIAMSISQSAVSNLLRTKK